MEPLTGAEHDAFRRIAEALGANRPTQKRTAEPPAEASQEIPAPPSPEPASDELRLLDRVPVGLVVFREGKTIFANRTLLDMLGYPGPAEFAAAGGADSLFPGQHADWSAPAAGISSNPTMARRRDGSPMPVEARLHSVPWGSSTALMLSLREAAIPAREPARATESQAPPPSEDRVGELEAILDTATDGVIVIDAKGRIDRVNRSAEALFGIEGRAVRRPGVHRPSRRGEPQGGARLSRRARLERRRQRAQRWPRGDRQGAARAG